MKTRLARWFVGTLMTFLLVKAVPALGTEIHVPNDYPTIQQAIEASVSGDTVIVHSGTYIERINFLDRIIELRSLDGAEATIIEGEVSIYNQEGGVSVLDGFTVADSPYNHAGLQISRSSPIIRNNIIRNHSNSGVSIRSGDCTPTIINNVIRDNSGPQAAGGMWISGAAPNIVGNTFLNNISQATVWDGGGAIAIDSYSSALIESNLFSGNEALHEGGAIFCSYYFERIVLSNNIFIDNRAVRGSVIGVTDYFDNTTETRGPGEFIASNNLFIGNYASDDGVMYWPVYCQMTIINCTFAGNEGGSVLGYAGGSVVRNSIFWGNDGPVTTGTPPITYSLVEGGYPGEGTIDADPLFVVGPSGAYYLSQTAAGQPVDSPCVDEGSDPASEICFQLHDGDICLDELTTRNDRALDTGQADMGYHYSPTAEPDQGFIAAGLGPHTANPSDVRVLPPVAGTQPLEFEAYPVSRYGVNVATGNLSASHGDEIISGPGPGPVFGPHVRGWLRDGTPLPGLSFLAYGTGKFGVNVSSGNFDGDEFDEILTGAGPGAVFGPHVRAFDYDGGPAVSPLSGVDFLAYGTLKWGVNVTAGDLDGDGYDEIVTGAGPGAVFGPHVRGWNVDGGMAAAMPGISYFAYGTHRFGVTVACGDVDGDGMAEIVTAPGPSPTFAAHIRGWAFDGASISEMPGLSFLAWPAGEAQYGATVWAGTDLDNDGRDEIVVGAGPGLTNSPTVKGYSYEDGAVTPDFTLEAFPAIYTHGVNVAAGRF